MKTTHTGTKPVLVGVSGPDEVGKTTLVRGLAQILRQRGCAVSTAHCYGCVLCRRLPDRRHSTTRAQPGPAAALLRFLHGAHCLLDAAELRARLAMARLSVRRGRAATTAVITDRGPLDTLAKFDPVPGSSAARRLTRLAGRYDVTLLLLDGPQARAGYERQSDDPVADGWRLRYRRWERNVPGVKRLAAGGDPSETAAEAIRLMSDRAPTAAARTGPPRVVISNFDNTGQADYGGGSAVTLERVARSLAEEFQVTVVTAGRRGCTRAEGRVTYRVLPVAWAGPRGGQLLFQAVLPFAARRIPHELWMENLTPPFSAGLLPLVTRAPVVGIDKVRYGEFLRRKYHLPFQGAERIGYRRYRNLVVMNHADADAIRSLSPRTTVEVIPNGVDPPADRTRDGAQGPDDATADGAQGPDDATADGYILFMGRIDLWQKGLDLLLAAYARSGVTLPLVMAGHGTKAEEKRLGKLLDEFGMTTQDTPPRPAVRTVGHVEGERKHRLLQASTFVVMPSRQETFGVVALEAMSYGKPVVHFDLPALRWMGGDGDVRVAPFDVDSLAEQIRQLADDPALRQSLGARAVLTARQYTVEAMTQRYRSLARRLLAPSDRPAAPVHER
ncbi:glycosyltransferase [Streptomyces sp. NPDC005931]|uniref:glycosyltransferase n=1 Tax=Streptomyces sp. NPDC005931 TaxID=3364737 RepID=UPI0036C7C50E